MQNFLGFWKYYYGSAWVFKKIRYSDRVGLTKMPSGRVLTQPIYWTMILSYCDMSESEKCSEFNWLKNNIIIFHAQVSRCWKKTSDNRCAIFEILAHCALIRQQRWSAVFQQRLTCARKIMMLLLSQLNSEHFSISLTSRYHCPYKLKIETAVFHRVAEWDTYLFSVRIGK